MVRAGAALSRSIVVFCNTFGAVFIYFFLKVTVPSTASSHVFLDEEEHKKEMAI